MELGEKGRVYDLWKKGKATQEDCKDVMMLCGEKIGRDSLQLNLATAIKTIKNVFYKYAHRKRRGTENLHPLMNALVSKVSKVSVVSKDEKRLRYLMPSLHQSVTVRLTVP